MYYVLKFVGAGPDNFLEHCYDEVIAVKNRIALVQFEHNKNRLLGQQFEEIGTVNSEEDLKSLLGEATEVKVRTETKVVPLDEILSCVPEDDNKSWYENLQ